MTRYTVTWLEGAQNQLAELWLEAADRIAVTDAANRSDRALAGDPQDKGSPVSEGLRSLVVPPLYVLFSVSEPDRLVEVASVRRELPTTPTNGVVQPPS
jgi:hypothetical protein